MTREGIGRKDGGREKWSDGKESWRSVQKLRRRTEGRDGRKEQE